MRQDDLESEAQSLTRVMTGQGMERVSSSKELLEAITQGDVFLTFADTQWVTTGLRDDRVYFFNPDSSHLPVGSILPGDDLPSRRVEEDGEQSLEWTELDAWFRGGKVRALKVV